MRQVRGDLKELDKKGAAYLRRGAGLGFGASLPSDLRSSSSGFQGLGASGFQSFGFRV